MEIEQKRERLEELRKAIKPQYLLICNDVLAGKPHGEAYMAHTKVKTIKSAHAAVARLFANTKNGCAEYIELMKWFASATSAEKLGIDKYWVLKGLKTNVERGQQMRRLYHKTGKPIEEFAINELTGDEELVGVFTFDISGTNRSLELIGKELGMFKDKIEVDQVSPFLQLMGRVRESNSEEPLLPSQAGA